MPGVYHCVRCGTYMPAEKMLAHDAVCSTFGLRERCDCGGERFNTTDSEGNRESYCLQCKRSGPVVRAKEGS